THRVLQCAVEDAPPPPIVLRGCRCAIEFAPACVECLADQARLLERQGGASRRRWPGVSARLCLGRPAWRTPGHTPQDTQIKAGLTPPVAMRRAAVLSRLTIVRVAAMEALRAVACQGAMPIVEDGGGVTNRYLTGTSPPSPTCFVAATVVPPARTRGMAPLA